MFIISKNFRETVLSSCSDQMANKENCLTRRCDKIHRKKFESLFSKSVDCFCYLLEEENSSSAYLPMCQFRSMQKRDQKRNMLHILTVRGYLRASKTSAIELSCETSQQLQLTYNSFREKVSSQMFNWVLDTFLKHGNLDSWTALLIQFFKITILSK